MSVKEATNFLKGHLEHNLYGIYNKKHTRKFKLGISAAEHIFYILLASAKQILK